MNFIKNIFFKFFLFLTIVIFFATCNIKNKQQPVLFALLEANKTGLNFTNTVKQTNDVNMFKYMYFYNGAGVASGDFNNDGLADLFFTSNQGQNKLFLNKGNLQFDDKTVEAKIPNDNAWNTGVSVVDINNDGLLDLYISRVGNFGKLQSQNQFLICKGIKNNVPIYVDEAKVMGLNISAFGTQAAFFDYDGDKDLDVYIMNHSLRYNGTFNDRNTYDKTRDSLAGDFLMQNNNGKFTDVSAKAGITGTVISYGLGICVSDINVDGWPDILIGNDFHENDYLYINQKNGTFKETLKQQTNHTSQFSMGVDVADINNDMFPDFISMDMLPSDPKILKRSLGDDEYNLFNYKVKAGYQPQVSRNVLHLNNKNNSFSDVAMYAGVEATDWSWASLWLDFNNDGDKDLFVSNGIPKRMNDMDYIAFVSNQEVQQKIRDNKIDEKDMSIVNNFPEIKLKNKFFQNKKNAKFEDIENQISNDKQTFSNGAVYADLDNDGDLDVVVNNINDPAMLYENKTVKTDSTKSITLKLKGDNLNRNALGAKVLVYQNGQKQLVEKYAVRGFQSSMEVPLHIGLGSKKLDSIIVIWPNNTFEKLNIKSDTTIVVSYKTALPLFDYNNFVKSNYINSLNVEDVTSAVNLQYKHDENTFNEFDREWLMPHMVSREGPALAVGDINNDGLEDVFLGASKFYKSKLFTQNTNGTFVLMQQTDLYNDSTYEDVDANFVDVNNDKFLDLVVASGGNEYYGNSEFLMPRVYINDGNGIMLKNKLAFDKNILLTASCIKPYDFNNDGFVDLFIGARAVPFEYGKIPTSYLLQNDGKGNFKDVTKQYSSELATIGFVTNATWVNIDNEPQSELVLSLEWGGIVAFKMESNKYVKKTITNNLGWWRCIVPIDVDADGDMDLVAGNLGENNRMKPTIENPVTMYYADFDNNGKKEQVVTYYLNQTEIPFGNKDELVKQLPSFKKKFLYAADFAKSNINDIFGKQKLRTADKFKANYFSSVVFINNGNFEFLVKKLPWQAQLSTCNNFAIIQANNDNLPDLFVASNFYYSNVQMGKYDADYGTVLINRGSGNFEANNFAKYLMKGEVKHIKPITINKELHYILTKNNDSTKVLKFKK